MASSKRKSDDEPVAMGSVAGGAMAVGAMALSALVLGRRALKSARQSGRMERFGIPRLPADPDHDAGEPDNAGGKARAKDRSPAND
ncbi:hypothetical protein [Amorphus orientalis]|uniref:Uncharacterized protein n=1 Tax=Amorphus orientalis TaxID=649198 RepID=A0AAE3VR93_9HYPH|nr:hypothetical protein [Amorphus orientalis]MDQ0316696.1 hypothetical protein [Amorphus orientalis]